MPDNIIVENCSPTLAGIKTGNIFTVDRSLITDINEELRQLNQCFAGKGLHGRYQKRRQVRWLLEGLRG